MAEDLRHQATAGIAVQACGDCHLMNFGAFATPEENILFDINDFDETLPGVDFTVDLKRLAAATTISCRSPGLHWLRSPCRFRKLHPLDSRSAANQNMIAE